MRNCDECFDCRKEDAKPKLLSLVEVAETLRKYYAITTGTRYEPWGVVHDAVCVNCGLTFESDSDLVCHPCVEEYKHSFLGEFKGFEIGENPGMTCLGCRGDFPTVDSLKTHACKTVPVRPSWDEYFLDIAKVVATRADCTRRKVGAVIVKNNRIISTGYNGAPAGKPGCLTDGACPRGKLTYEEQPKDVGYANCGSVHAESNAIIYAHQDLRDATLYCTDKPCVECEKLIAGAGIKTVITP